ncbi:MAG: alpha/beta fold hydrolase [Cyanobacteria bacterium P01_F01_bin.143]
MSEGLIAIRGTENAARVADIVFVHGLGGHYWSTWHPQESEEDTHFFPMWLGDDFPDYGIWSMDYDSSLVRSEGSQMPILDLAAYMAAELDSEDLGRHPLIFITHSMGGILVKQMLRNAQDYGDSYRKRLVDQTRGIVFIATPHSGSDLVSFFKFLKSIVSINVQELEASHPRLLELNRAYRSHEILSQIPVQVFRETKPTTIANISKIIVVDAATADPGIAQVEPIPIPDADHISISKPESKKTTVYKSVKTFISRNIQTQQPLPNLQGSDKPVQPQFADSKKKIVKK